MILFSGSLNAQNANFELAEQFTSDRMQKLTCSTFLRANWIEDEDRLWYEWESGEGKRWEFVDTSNQSRRPVVHRFGPGGYLRPLRGAVL